MSSLNTKCYWNLGYVTRLDLRSSTDTSGEKPKFQLSTKDFQNRAKNRVSHEKNSQREKITWGRLKAKSSKEGH